MSKFGNNLIERLRTGLVDVQSQNQLGEGSIALAKNLNINANVKKRGERKSRLSGTCSVPVVASVAHDGDSFDGFRAPEKTGLNSAT
jgi:hypothetical protein